TNAYPETLPVLGMTYRPPTSCRSPCLLGARGPQRKPLHSFRRDGGPPFEFRAGTRPELRIPGDAAQKRMVSVAGIRLDPRKSARPFKGIIFPDVSEFESYMPSQSVRLCGLCSGCRNRRDRRKPLQWLRE